MEATHFDFQAESSSEKRRELMRNISDLFIVGAKQLEDKEAVLLEETFTDLLFRLPMDEQSEVAERVADSKGMPNPVAVKLANAGVHIAAPIIERSPVLTDDDLADIAARHGQDHLMALSKRPHIGSRLTDIIVERANNDVLGTLAGNHTAELSAPSFSKLVERASDSEMLQDALSRRSDIPPEAAAKLVPLLCEEARHRLAQLLQKDGEQVSVLFREAEAKVARNRFKKSALRLGAKALLEDVRNGVKTIDEVIVLLAQHDRVLDVIMILTKLGDIAESQGLNAFRQKYAEPFAVLCRSAKLSEATVRGLQEMRRRRLGRSVQDIVPCWKTLTREDAQRILRFTQMSKGMREGG